MSFSSYHLSQVYRTMFSCHEFTNYGFTVVVAIVTNTQHLIMYIDFVHEKRHMNVLLETPHPP